MRLQLIADLPGRRLFQQYIQRYHPLGYRVPYGAQLRYVVSAPSQGVLACLLFTSAAWKMAPRDTWIGWSDQARRMNLSHLVNNARFLILPWVQVPHLASHILALAAHQPRAIGRRPMECVPSCWRLWWTVPTPAFATAPPTGSWWARPKAVAAWIAPIKPTAAAKIFCCIRWRRAGANAYASSHHFHPAMLLLEKFHELLQPWRSAFPRQRTWQRAQLLANGLLTWR